MGDLCRKIRNGRRHAMAGLLYKQTQRACAAVILIRIMVVSKRD